MSGLALRSLTLSHFRSYDRFQLNTDPRPVVLFGPNGVGKTNVLEAISLLSPGRGLRRTRADQLALRPTNVGWKISASLQRNNQEHEVVTFSTGGSRSVQLNGKPVAQLALGKTVPMIWLVPAMDRLWTEAAEGRRRFLDRLTLNFFPDHGKAVLAYEKAMRDRNKLLKDGVRDGHWYTALETQMAQSGVALTHNRLRSIQNITAAQSTAETMFPVAELALGAPEGGDVFQTAADLEDAFREGRARDVLAGRTLDGPHRDDLMARYASKGVAARDCSTGEQKALLISLILATARCLQTGDGVAPLVLLDEVAAHLDSDRQAALYDEVCSLGSQAWMTGTGPDLFTALGPRAQCIALSESDA